MKIKLFANHAPEGRCLTLIQKLRNATSLTATECVELAQRLFAFRYIRENPASVEVSDLQSFADLAATCAEFGISVEITDDNEVI